MKETTNPQILKQYVQGLLEASGFAVIDYSAYRLMSGEQLESLGKPVVVKNYRYDKVHKVDFFDVAAQRAVECKYQHVSGSACEKIMYAALSLAQQPFDSVLVYEGSAYSKDLVGLSQKALRAFCKEEGIGVSKVQLMSLGAFEASMK